MKKYLVVVECAIEYDNKFLLIERPVGTHAEGLLSFVGGKVDEQDEVFNTDILRNAIKREVFEEVGINIDGKLEYVTSSYFVDSKGICVIDNIFYHKLDTMPEIIANQREVPWFAWMHREEINNASNAPEWLKQYLDKISMICP